MLCVEFFFDCVNLGSSPVLDALVENYVCHLHGRYQTVYVFERHGDVILIFREFAIHPEFFEIIKDQGVVLASRFTNTLKIVQNLLGAFVRFLAVTRHERFSLSGLIAVCCIFALILGLVVRGVAGSFQIYGGTGLIEIFESSRLAVLRQRVCYFFTLLLCRDRSGGFFHAWNSAGARVRFILIILHFAKRLEKVF